MQNKEKTLSFRKLNLGLASVAVAAFLAANPQEVHAQENGTTNVSLITTYASATPTNELANDSYEIQDPQQAEKALEIIRNTRNTYYDDETVPFEGIPLKNYVTQKGLTKEQYVNDVRYDRMNEKDAYIRAEETAIHGKIDHKGPDGVSKPQYKNSNATLENLSWGRPNVEADMKAWTSDELPALKEANGKFTANNGHLYQILNPNNISFGYGRFSKFAPGVDSSKFKNAIDPIGNLTISRQVGDTDYPAGKITETIPTPEDQKNEPIPFEVERIEDSTLEKGKTIVKQEGEDGLRDSKGVVIRQPKNKIILVGTKEAEKTESTNPEPTKPNPDPTLDEKPTTPVTPDPQPEPEPVQPKPEEKPTPKPQPEPANPNPTKPELDPVPVQDPKPVQPTNITEPELTPDPVPTPKPIAQPTKPTLTVPSTPLVSPTSQASTAVEPTLATPTAVAPTSDSDKSVTAEEGSQDPTSVTASGTNDPVTENQNKDIKTNKVLALAPKEEKFSTAKATSAPATHSVLPKTGVVAASFTGFGLALVAAGATVLKRRK
ncbi:MULTISPECIES: G5 domain-containing protein [Aerococcus]|uniref:YSIRK-type signal peptide-containing protein n=2 Tax=Aerococcus TaxID=1375 RepID=A0A178HHQ4_9LACT|nr:MULTISPECIES: G5 domain-containing protein [Aerococcus]KAA9220188.1 YSIRK-type signal peptide-containing protein [Aerococcus loyolae]MCY3025214.1 G5 domain-containing protein [Aerococcus loyolae]MCY3029305.1 G5 domain-containing protein [Aerococcus loyolae]MDK6231991.1 G5 domain-containing protein [Aerococcus urinae]MDK6257783.1 G5 domain-containing protein [Aerococcus urinae]